MHQSDYVEPSLLEAGASDTERIELYDPADCIKFATLKELKDIGWVNTDRKRLMLNSAISEFVYKTTYVPGSLGTTLEVTRVARGGMGHVTAEDHVSFRVRKEKDRQHFLVSRDDPSRRYVISEQLYAAIKSSAITKIACQN